MLTLSLIFTIVCYHCVIERGSYSRRYQCSGYLIPDITYCNRGGILRYQSLFAATSFAHFVIIHVHFIDVLDSILQLHELSHAAVRVILFLLHFQLRVNFHA